MSFSRFNKKRKQIFVLYNPNVAQRDIFLEPNLSVIRGLSCTCYLVAKSSTITRCETCEHLRKFQLSLHLISRFEKWAKKNFWSGKELRTFLSKKYRWFSYVCWFSRMRLSCSISIASFSQLKNFINFVNRSRKNSYIYFILYRYIKSKISIPIVRTSFFFFFSFFLFFSFSDSSFERMLFKILCEFQFFFKIRFSFCFFSSFFIDILFASLREGFLFCKRILIYRQERWKNNVNIV